MPFKTYLLGILLPYPVWGTWSQPVINTRFIYMIYSNWEYLQLTLLNLAKSQTFGILSSNAVKIEWRISVTFIDCLWLMHRIKCPFCWCVRDHFFILSSTGVSTSITCPLYSMILPFLLLVNIDLFLSKKEWLLLEHSHSSHLGHWCSANELIKHYWSAFIYPSLELLLSKNPFINFSLDHIFR